MSRLTMFLWTRDSYVLASHDDDFKSLRYCVRHKNDFKASILQKREWILRLKKNNGRSPSKENACYMARYMAGFMWFEDF